MNVLVINGPNLNMLGVREPGLYGTMSLDDVNGRLRALADELGGIELELFQSNHEGAIVDRIQAGHGRGLAGAIINPGGLTHTSVSIHDAIKAVDYPFVEVHLTNLQQREEWRRQSYVSMAAVGTIAGLGWRGYELALRWLASWAGDTKTPK